MKTRPPSADATLVPFPAPRSPWRTLLRVVLVAGVTFAAFAAWAAATWDVNAVRVTGVRTIGADRVVDATGLTGSERILLTRMGPISRRVEAIPGIRRARVSRSLPSTVLVEVTERTALAALEGDPELAVGVDGLLFPARTAQSIPVLSGIAIPRAEAGERLGVGVARTLAAYARFPDGLRERVARIDGSGGRLLIVLQDGTEVRFGEPTDLAGKAVAAAAVLEEAERDGTALSYVDVRLSRSPVSKTREPDPENG